MAELRARLRVHYANCRLGRVPEYCVTGRDLGDVSGGSGQPKLVYWSGSTRPGRPHEMYWELPHRDIGPVIEQLEGAEEITGLVSETLGSHAGQTICAMSHEQPAAIGQIASVLPADWEPAPLGPDFDDPERDAAALLLAQVTLGLSLPERPGDELALATSFVVPAMLAAELAEAESAIARRPRQDGSRLDPVTEALLLACTRRQLVQVGLSPLAPERDAAAHRAANACAGYLHLLVALDGGRDSAVQVALWRTRGRAQARITLRPLCARPPVPR